RQRPVAVTRAVIEAHQEHRAVALDDRVRADLHVHEVGKAAHRARGALAPVDARRDEASAIAWAKLERAASPSRAGPSGNRWIAPRMDPRHSAARDRRSRSR